MSHWETAGASDEWYTPAYIFDALDATFDLDVAAPEMVTHVPASAILTKRVDGLTTPWNGLIWMNPPFGGRNGLVPWLDKFFDHANGVALVPDRTSAPWFQHAAQRADLALFISPKVRFERPDGSLGKSPSTGTALFSIGAQGNAALRRGARLGWLVQAP